MMCAFYILTLEEKILTVHRWDASAYRWEVGRILFWFAGTPGIFFPTFWTIFPLQRYQPLGSREVLFIFPELEGQFMYWWWLCLSRSLLPLGWHVTVVCSVRISTTWLICIGLLDLQVIAYCLNHSRSSLSQVIPSGARYLCLLWAIYLCEKQYFPWKSFLSFTLDRNCLQRLRTCVSFPTALSRDLSKPLSLASDAMCLTFLSSNGNLSALLAQHQTNQVMTCWSFFHLSYNTLRDSNFWF